MKNTIYLSFLFFLLSAALPAQNNRLYVSSSANGAANGGSWADAFTNLHMALGLAQAGDSIWMAEGVYAPAVSAARDSSFVLPSGVLLFGGFSGTENSLDERDWAAHPTILSGDIGVAGDSTDNAYTILYLENPDSGTVIDGMIFRHGIANFTPLNVPGSSPKKCGGGLYIMAADGWAYPDIRNCTFEYCYAYNSGGAVYINGSGVGSVAPRFFNCTFRHNSVRVDGGALYKNGGSWVERTPDFEGCSFVENRADRRGGGIYVSDKDGADTLDVVSCRFIKNHSVMNGGGMCYQSNHLSTNTHLTVSSCSFYENTSQKGSAIGSFNPSIYLSIYKIEIISSSIKNNFITPSAESHISLKEFLAVPGSTFRAEKDSFLYNINGESFDGGLQIDSDIFVSESIFVENGQFSQIRLDKGNTINYNKNYIYEPECSKLFAMYSIQSFEIKNSFIYAPLSVIFFNNKSIDQSTQFKNNSIIGNILIHRTDLIASPFLFHNNILQISDSLFDQVNSNTEDIVCKFEHCLIDSNLCNQYPDLVFCAASNLYSLDPLFVNPDSFDFRLQPCSPLVNAGNNAFAAPGTDLAGLPRILGGTVDIGAYETALPTLATQPEVSPACPGTASGSAAFEVSGGCEPFAYAWANTAGGSGTGADGLTPGDYTFTITDARGSAFTATLSVPPGSPIALTPAPTPLLCGDTLGGSAAMSVAQAHPPIQFLWDDGSTDSLRTPLAPGNYAITVTDAIGCTAAGTIEVGITGNLGIDISVQEISCHGAADGALNILPANGVPPFQWLWAGGDTSATLQPIGPGQYAGTLTDAYGCTIGWYVPLGQPDSLIYSAQLSPSSSPPAANGSILLSDIAGGTQPYAILWSNGDTGPLADSLPAGPHAMTLTDAHGCAYTAVFNLGTSGTTSAADAPAGFDLLPNPARDVVWVLPDAPAPTEMPLLVHDASGRLLLRQTIPAGTSRWPIPVADWPRGALWVQLWDGKRWQTRVVTVQ